MFAGIGSLSCPREVTMECGSAANKYPHKIQLSSSNDLSKYRAISRSNKSEKYLLKSQNYRIFLRDIPLALRWR
jgi:hypothetical protein